MSKTDSDAYWVGAFAMSLAMSHMWLLTGRPDIALHEIDDVLTQFVESGIWQEDSKLAALVSDYWQPATELERR